MSWSEMFDRAQAARNFDGVRVTDVVGAVAACRLCIDSHCDALLCRTIWDARVPLEHDEKQREMAVYQDSDGEGKE